VRLANLTVSSGDVEIAVLGERQTFGRCENDVKLDRIRNCEINLRLAGLDEGPAVFAIDAGTGGQPQRRSTLSLHRTTGEVVRWEPFAAQSAGRRLRSWTRFTHTGEYYGLAGQTVAGIASAGAMVLVYTGLLLAFRRLYGWVARRRTVDRDATPRSEAA